MSRIRAFTLVELLVSMAIGAAIIAATWSAFVQIRNTTVKSKALAAISGNAAVVHMALGDMFEAMFHGSQFRIGISDAGDPVKAAITIDVMNAQRQRYQNRARETPSADYRNDLVWNRLRFVVRDTGDADGRPALYKAVSSSTWTLAPTSSFPKINSISMVTDPADAGRQVPAWVNEDVVIGSTTNASTSVVIGPEVRRDRRRSMLDNDTRLMPNIPQSVYKRWTTDSSGARVKASDDENLESRFKLVTDDISHLRIEVIDCLGRRTICGVDPGTGAPTGLVYVDKDGVAIAPVPPDPTVAGAPDVWSSSLRVVDGIWSDGRSDPCPYNPSVIILPNPALERPALIRFSFRMNDRPSKSWREFSFSFPLSSITVKAN